MTPLVVVVGETASGKSDLALKLAERFNGELICADSWTVRREVNIGTAKPSAADQQRARHHLLNVVEPCEEFTAAVFKDLAKEAIEDIASRGKLAVMVGGTGLYLDSVLYDYGFLPEGDRTARGELNSKTAEELVELAHSKNLDTSGIDIRNKRRIIRLIETGGGVPKRSELRPGTLVIGVSLPREELNDRITSRVDAMLAAGLEEEVRALSQKYGWACAALKGIGYAEWREYFEGSTNLEQTRQKIISSTHGLAKRQRTWFKRNKSIHWENDPSKVVEIVTTFLNTQSL